MELEQYWVSLIGMVALLFRCGPPLTRLSLPPAKHLSMATRISCASLFEQKHSVLLIVVEVIHIFEKLPNSFKKPCRCVIGNSAISGKQPFSYEAMSRYPIFSYNNAATCYLYKYVQQVQQGH